MGMGEPLANYKNVMEAVRRINTELGIGARHITLSTSGMHLSTFTLAIPPVSSKHTVFLLHILYIIHPSFLSSLLSHLTPIPNTGIAPRIRTLADEDIQVGLAISLHQTSDAKRSPLMPINDKYPIQELLDACRYYIKQTGRRVTFEWALIRNQTE